MVAKLLVVLATFLPCGVVFVYFFALLVTDVLAITICSCIFRGGRTMGNARFDASCGAGTCGDTGHAASVLLPLILVFITIVVFANGVAMRCASGDVVLSDMCCSGLGIGFSRVSDTRLTRGDDTMGRFNFGGVMIGLNKFRGRRCNDRAHCACGGYGSIILVGDSNGALLVGTGARGRAGRVCGGVLARVNRWGRHGGGLSTCGVLQWIAQCDQPFVGDWKKQFFQVREPWQHERIRCRSRAFKTCCAGLQRYKSFEA